MSKISILQLQRQNPLGYQTSQKCFRISAKTDVIAASLAANSVLFALRPGVAPPIDSPAFAYIERIRLQWTTITAFGTPVTAGRSLRIGTGTNVEPTGGTTQTRAFAKTLTGAGSSVFDFAVGDTGGRIVIADTAALSGPVPDDPYLAEVSLAGFGTAGASKDITFDFTANDTAPIALCRSGFTQGLQNLIVYAPQEMDATGTFELIVELDTCELPDGYDIPNA